MSFNHDEDKPSTTYNGSIQASEKDYLIGDHESKTTDLGLIGNAKRNLALWGTKEFWKEKAKGVSLRVVIYFVLLVAFGVANSVTGRFNQLKFGDNYAWFNNQFTTLSYSVMAQIITSWKYFFTKDITPEMKQFPLWKFALFGFFDGTAGFLFSIGAPNTPATIQNIVNQTIIPVTMLMSFIILRARYKLPKILGAGVILGGAFIALIPLFLNHGSDGGGAKAVWYSIIIYVSNNIPQGLSNVTKELAFQQVVLDVYYLGSWVAWFQLFFSICLLPVTTLPGFGGIPFKQIPKQIADGYFCLLGWDSQEGDSCSLNYVFTSMYIIVNFFYNIFILLVTKHASATLFTIAFAIRLPITQLVYTLRFIMGKYTEPFNWETIVSLVVVLLGFGIYSLFGNSSESEGAEKEKTRDPSLFTEDEGGVERSVVLPYNPRTAGFSEQIIRVRPQMARNELDVRRTYLYKLGIKTAEQEAILAEDRP